MKTDDVHRERKERDGDLPDHPPQRLYRRRRLKADAQAVLVGSVPRGGGVPLPKTNVRGIFFNPQKEVHSMPRLTLLIGTGMALVAMAVAGSALAGKPGAGTCSGGNVSGTYSGFTVTGNCSIPDGASLTVNGNLTIADGGSLNAISLSTVHVTGNVKVGKGATLGLGCNFFANGPTCRAWGAPNLRNYWVEGNIDANKPLTMYLDFVVVDGNVVSNGGGPGTSQFLNFVVKDNAIHGNLIIHGWQGGWWGVIRNDIGGNADLSNNASVVTETGPGVDTDASEVQGSGPPFPSVPQTIHGNLICHGNTPAAHINAGDGGVANIVEGNAIGECSGLAG
jgi:hypothetical protein